MEIKEIPELDRWKGAPRVWATGFVLFAGMGLAVSLAMVMVDSGVAPADVGTRFAGPETDDIFPHSFHSLLQTTHTHLYTIAFLEFLLGGLLLMSTLSDRAKLTLIGGAWTFILCDHAGMWLTFQWGKDWVWLMMLGGTGMTLFLGLQIIACLKDLLKSR